MVGKPFGDLATGPVFPGAWRWLNLLWSAERSRDVNAEPFQTRIRHLGPRVVDTDVALKQRHVDYPAASAESSSSACWSTVWVAFSCFSEPT